MKKGIMAFAGYGKREIPDMIFCIEGEMSHRMHVCVLQSNGAPQGRMRPVLAYEGGINDFW
jgi:hypothetical protein